MKRWSIGFGVLLFATVVIGPSSQTGFAAIQYTGTISNIVGPGDGDLVTRNRWDNVSASLTWTVTDNADIGGTWHYEYVFTHGTGATSHILLEVSENVDDAGLFLNASGGDVSLGSGGAPSNPSIPGGFTNVVKFNNTTGTTTTIKFDIARAPTWGDFYAKDGGNPTDVAWNSGFIAGESVSVASNDPTNIAPDNGVGYVNGLAHILVPDTDKSVIPEPASILVWGLLGAIGISVGWWRKRR